MTLYQVIEVYTDDTPMRITTLGKAHTTRPEAIKAVEAFLWEEVAQRTGEVGDLTEHGIEFDRDIGVYVSEDSTFEWRILEITDEESTAAVI